MNWIQDTFKTIFSIKVLKLKTYLDIVEDVEARIIIDGSISSNPLCNEIVSNSVWDLDKYSEVVKVADVGFL